MPRSAESPVRQRASLLQRLSAWTGRVRPTWTARATATSRWRSAPSPWLFWVKRARWGWHRTRHVLLDFRESLRIRPGYGPAPAGE